jgi:NADH-quinone oxidoreductase subunit C
MAAPMADGVRLEIQRLRDRLGEAVLMAKEFRGELYVGIERGRIADAVNFLKADPELEYTYFVECVGIDYSAWTHERDLDGRFEVVYNLYSLKHHSRIFLKVSADDGMTIPTCKDVFIGAEYPEREISDLFGVVFTGNEPKGRFLLPDDWVGFPLRKEYPLGGEDVVFHEGTEGPAVEDLQTPHAGESWDGKTGSGDVSGR